MMGCVAENLTDRANPGRLQTGGRVRELADYQLRPAVSLNVRGGKAVPSPVRLP